MARDASAYGDPVVRPSAALDRFRLALEKIDNSRSLVGCHAKIRSVATESRLTTSSLAKSASGPTSNILCTLLRRASSLWRRSISTSLVPKALAATHVSPTFWTGGTELAEVRASMLAIRALKSENSPSGLVLGKGNEVKAEGWER